MDLGAVYQSIVDGKAVLLTGTGAHVGVKNADGGFLPSGYQLAGSLFQAAGLENVEEYWDLQDASDSYIEKKDELNLIQEIKRILRVGMVTDSQRALYGNEWQRVYTTNYDTVPLVATGKSDYPLSPVTLGMNYERDWLEKNLCIYINGYIERLDEKTLRNEFKLTSQSYLTANYLEESQWGAVFAEDLETAECIVLVGVSLKYDFDIKRFISGKNVREKLVFIEKQDLTDDRKRIMNRMGTVYPIGVVNFTQQLSEYKKTHICEKNCVEIYKAFQRYVFRSSLCVATAPQVHGLFVTGNFQNCDELWFRKNGKYVTLVYRHELTDAIQLIKKGCRVIYLHANLGNGKTLFVELLKNKLQDTSYKIFTLQENIESLISREVKNIVNEEGKKLVIIENYYNFISVIQLFSLYDLSDVQFVFTARSVLYDTRILEVNEYLDIKEGESGEIDLNKLGNWEIDQLHRILSDNGLWGKKSSVGKSEQYKILKKRGEGNREFQNILYHILQSEDIKQRFEEIVDAIHEMNETYYQVLVLALLVKTMSLNIEARDIGNILDVNIAFDTTFTNNSNVKEILDFSSGGAEYRIRSAVTARMILQDLQSDDVIIKVLLKTAEYANRYCQLSKYENVLKNIISYSHVKTFLGRRKQVGDFLIEYYDGLKQLSYYKENSFYWLQYAIACINVHRLDLAQRFIDNAYSYFRDSDYTVPFQIDTQQAKLLLLKIDNRESKEIKDTFVRAHELLMKPVVSKKDNPIKQLTNFNFYLRKNIITALKKVGAEEFYKKACGEAYNKVDIFLNNSSNRFMSTDLEKLRSKLLLAATENESSRNFLNPSE